MLLISITIGARWFVECNCAEDADYLLRLGGEIMGVAVKARFCHSDDIDAVLRFTEQFRFAIPILLLYSI